MTRLLTVALAGGLLVRSTFVVRRHASGSTAEPGETRSLVRVLRSPAEVDEAVQRAARFERRVEESLRVRTLHYESMLRQRGGHEPSDPLPVDPVAPVAN